MCQNILEIRRKLNSLLETTCQGSCREPLPREREIWCREARLDAMRTWELRLANPTAGRATVEAIRPNLQPWVERRYGVLTYRLTQVLTGHGAFGHYLHRVARREVTTACHQCGDQDDTALHTLAVCPAFAEPRAELTLALGGVDVASLSAVVAATLSRRTAWDALSFFCETVMSQKEVAECARENDPNAPQIRRRRMGRRRAAHERALPP
ncbi:uncharacterized protein LOC113501249 [Trichoplusia ni]|uniref:Uncharacterized protein LOC113501249 n=1 Tax=Trichoplusia ni TaxID=7111 RepID=A0A7E5WBQ8_TRINI|nr:uncharacterized protein LOC113501249 [Trichoplusia ni]